MDGGGTNTWRKKIMKITLDSIHIKLNGEGVFYKMLGLPTDSRVLCWSGANAAQVSSV